MLRNVHPQRGLTQLSRVSLCPGDEVCVVQIMPDQPSYLPANTFNHSLSVHTAGCIATNNQVGLVPATVSNMGRAQELRVVDGVIGTALAMISAPAVVSWAAQHVELA